MVQNQCSEYVYSFCQTFKAKMLKKAFFFIKKNDPVMGVERFFMAQSLPIFNIIFTDSTNNHTNLDYLESKWVNLLQPSTNINKQY